MLRCVVGLMVDVHKRPFDVRQHLDPVLKLLAEVVRLPQRRARVHDDVNLDVVVLQYRCRLLASRPIVEKTHRSAL